MFKESYRVHDLSSLNAKELLKYKLGLLETIDLPECIRIFNMRTIKDPHYMTALLQNMQMVLIRGEANMPA